MESRRFTVALSFPGEKRGFVSQVADALATKFGKQKVLYDKYHEAEFARPNLDVHLPNLYSTQSELIVIFLCNEYKQKRWCNLEWRSIRQLIATTDEDRIMFLSFDEIGGIPEIGILSGDGYAFIGDRSPEDIAALILQRLKPLADELGEPSLALPASVLTTPDGVSGDLKCCLLISEALAQADHAAMGGGPSTALHRRLDVAHRWMNEGKTLLTEFRDGIGSDLTDFLGRICSDALPLLIAEARRGLPQAGDDDKRRDNEYFKEARARVANMKDGLSRALKANPAFAALESSSQKWPILGFRDQAEYEDFLYPSVQTVARNSDPMQHDLFVRLLDRPAFSPLELQEEGYQPGMVMDTVNALLTVKWAKWTDRAIGSSARGTLTPVGQRMLRQLIGNPVAVSQSSESPKELSIWQEKLAFLLAEEAIVSDPAQKFTLKKQIAEAQAKIRELER